MPTLYDVLGVEREADAGAIRRAYRRLARKHHPDINPDPGSHDAMARINVAFETLIDPLRRREYDAALAGGDEDAAMRATVRKPVHVRLIKRFKAHRTPVYACAFTLDSAQLVTASFDNELVWWDRANWEPGRRLHLEGGVVSTMMPLRDGSVVAAGSAENLVSLWKVGEDAVDTARIPREDWVASVALSADGLALGGGSIQHRVLIASNGKRMNRTGHEGSVTAVAWSPDGGLLATGSADCTVKLWRRTDGQLLHTIQAIRSTVTAIAFSPDGRFVAVAAVDLSIRVFTLRDGQLQKMMFGHTRPIEALAFHPNGWLFASGGREGAVKLWNADKGLGQLHIHASELPIRTLAFSYDGGLLAASGLDKHVRVWEIKLRA